MDGPDGEPVPWSPAYRNLHLSALRGVLRTAWRLGEMSTDDYQRAAAVRNFRGTRLPAYRSVHAAEFTALLAACAADPSPAGVRDAALLAVLYTTGARRAEVAAPRGLRPGERSLRITGKGDKQRIEYVHEVRQRCWGRGWPPTTARPGRCSSRCTVRARSSTDR